MRLRRAAPLLALFAVVSAIVGLPRRVAGQVRLCNGVGRRYCAKAHLAPECPNTCLPEKCRGRRRVGYRRCANENWRSCYDYKWEQVAEYGWYDFTYVDGSRLCLGTCREEPEAMRCYRNEYLWLNGRRYCQMSDCRRARMGVQSGCHQERDFHRPTCKECSLIFATGCAPLYTEEDLLDSRPGKAEGNRRYRPFPDPKSMKEGAEEAKACEPSSSSECPEAPKKQPQPQPTQPQPSDAQTQEKPAGTEEDEEVMEEEQEEEEEKGVEVYEYEAEEEDDEYGGDDDYVDEGGAEDPLDVRELHNGTSETTPVVEASVQLGQTAEEFSSQDAAQLVSAIADVAGVSPQDVEVVSPSSARRRLTQAEEKDVVTTVSCIVVAQDLEGAVHRMEDADMAGGLSERMRERGLCYLPLSLVSRIVVVPSSMLRSSQVSDGPPTHVTVLAVGGSVATVILLLAVVLLSVWCVRRMQTSSPKQEEGAVVASTVSEGMPLSAAKAIAIDQVTSANSIPATFPQQH